LGGQIEKNLMGRALTAYEEWGIQRLVWKPDERGHSGDPGMDGRII